MAVGRAPADRSTEQHRCRQHDGERRAGQSSHDITVDSVTVTPAADNVPERHIRLGNVFNVRDLGGYPTTDGRSTKWRYLYRADGLNRLDDADTSLLATQGLRTIVDLRTQGEIDNWGAAPHEVLGAQWVHRPLIPELWADDSSIDDLDPIDYLVSRYVEMLDHGRGVFAEIIELVADDHHVPLVFHCSAGKDRTGVTAAILLGLAGVDHTAIAADYHLTAPAMAELTAWIRRQHPEHTSTMTDQNHTFMAAPIEAMERLLVLVDDRHGSIENYVRDLGVGADTIEAYRTAVLA